MTEDNELERAVSVVICTRNHRDQLLETLESLACQKWRGVCEVLVVDNGSKDGTSDAVRGYAAGFPVPLRLAEEPQAGLSFARNRGAGLAGGRVLLFIDDDVTCRPGWLEAHASAFEDPTVVGTGGRILPILPSSAPPWWNEVLPHEVGGPTARYDFGLDREEIRHRGRIGPPVGANMGILREWVLELGGFRTDLGWGRRMIPADETEFYRRAQARAARFLYVPDACVEHRIAPDRLSRDYYDRWQQGKGRSGVIIEPPRGAICRLVTIAKSMARLGVASVRAQWLSGRGDVVSTFSAIRKRERMKGRLYELIGR